MNKVIIWLAVFIFIMSSVCTLPTILAFRNSSNIEPKSTQYIQILIYIDGSSFDSLREFSDGNYTVNVYGQRYMNNDKFYLVSSFPMVDGSISESGLINGLVLHSLSTTISYYVNEKCYITVDYNDDNYVYKFDANNSNNYDNQFSKHHYSDGYNNRVIDNYNLGDIFTITFPGAHQFMLCFDTVVEQ